MSIKHKHPVLKIRKPMAPPTKVQNNPKKTASKSACRNKTNWSNYDENYL